MKMENRIIDDAKFPVVRDNKIKTCCYATLELLKDRYKLSKSKYTRCLQKENITEAIPEEDVLSDDEEPKTITLTKGTETDQQVYQS